jgi:hypothetical protein
MKRIIVLAIAALLLITSITAVLVTSNLLSGNRDQEFYVGVTYGGDNVADAELLIDKVKDYTNLFILVSGDLQRNATALDEIGDYAIAAGLNFAAYFGIIDGSRSGAEWIDTAQQRWGSHFLGVYFYDEPGGKMLDSVGQDFSKNDIIIGKLAGGGIGAQSNNTQTDYYRNGTTSITYRVADKSKNGTLEITSPEGQVTRIPNAPWPENYTGLKSLTTLYPNNTMAVFTPPEPLVTTITYSPDGAITVWESQGSIFYTAINGSERISQVEPLSDILDRNPIRTYDEAAQAFEDNTAKYLQPLENQSVAFFTSDYALYWWDYKNGYDMVLAELGWNNTVTQEIGLVRGAANLQDKSWGTIITWKYTQPPYLASGEDVYDQMRLSYECGANYVVLFNYAEDLKGAYGTLQNEHFQALERFWNDVVQNSSVVQGGIKAEAALVLPRNYGWGMRNPSDIIWGFWDANATSQQIWNQVQSKLDQYGSKLDIVYEDSAYPVAGGNYSKIIYWNQTS